MIVDEAVYIQGRFNNDIYNENKQLNTFWDRKIFTLDDIHNPNFEFITKNSQSIYNLKLASLSVSEREYYKVLTKINQDEFIRASVLSASFLPGLNDIIIVECCDYELIESNFSEYSPKKYEYEDFLTIFCNVHITSLVGQKVRVHEPVHRNQLGVIIDIDLDQKKALVQLPATLSIPQLDLYPSKPILFTSEFISKNKISTLSEKIRLNYSGSYITVQKFRDKIFYESYELSYIKFSSISVQNTTKRGKEIDPSEQLYSFLKNTISYRRTLKIFMPPLLENPPQASADAPVRTPSFDASNEEIIASEDDNASVVISRKMSSTRSLQRLIELPPTDKKRSVLLRYMPQKGEDIRPEPVAMLPKPEPIKPAPKVTEKPQKVTPKNTWEPDLEYGHLTPKPLGKKILSNKDYLIQKLMPLQELMAKEPIPFEFKTNNGFCVSDTVITEKGDIGMIQSISNKSYTILSILGTTVDVPFDLDMMRIADDNTVRDASNERLFLNDVVVIPDSSKVRLGVVIHALRNRAYVRDENSVTVHNGSMLRRINIEQN